MAVISSQGAYSVGIAEPFTKTFTAHTNFTETSLPAIVKIIIPSPMMASPRPLVGLIWPRGTK